MTSLRRTLHHLENPRDGPHLVEIVTSRIIHRVITLGQDPNHGLGIGIREEIRAIERGDVGDGESPLAHAPHPAEVVCADQWPFAYTREQAAYPAPWTRDHKFWPPVSRIDNAFGDRNLVCTCPPLEDLVEGDGED